MKIKLVLSIISLASIFILPCKGQTLGAPGLEIVPTFNSAGIYWTPEALPDNPAGEVFYRKQGSSDWLSGLELYLLPREDDNYEYRGSIVNLESATDYEVLVQNDTENQTFSFTTWDDDFKIKKRIQIVPDANGFSTTEGGSQEEGYIVYEPSEGSDSTINAMHLHSVGIDVKHDWVIIRGWKIKGVKNYPIRLHSQQKYAVIEYCEISNWGTLSKNFAVNSNGIFLDGKDLIPSNIVIQYNYFHDPTFDTNNWSEPSDKTSAGNHPNGTQPIWLARTGGKLVIRYNTIAGSEDHYYNDGMGEWRNFGPHGFPYKDSDIHNNYISHCWDNCIEAEGGNINVRIYENFTDSSYAHYGLSNISLGPLYLFRNISFTAHKFPEDFKEGNFLKIGNKLKFDVTTGKEWPAAGRVYIFNNTILQPQINGRNNGITSFATSTGPSNGLIYYNNLMNMSGNISDSYEILPIESNVVFDYNQISGGIVLIFGAHSFFNEAVFDLDHCGYFLENDSQAIDAGKNINNFASDYFGTASDIGAYENGGECMEIGCGFAPVKLPKQANTSTLSNDISQNIMALPFPNPFKDSINISIAVNNSDDLNICLYDSKGQTIIELGRGIISASDITTTFYNISKELQPGIYFIKIANDNLNETFKLVKI
ncbi:MAG: T9SS type A sorting domain-containing protein [Bacteroidales bacterium]|nr:T9SS type A sorting domain-containing protein [Bacteroidales bacterium]MCF8389924.1 T9SS type A sorting domain-containing protein [Bacteroidales bacterium]